MRFYDYIEGIGGAVSSFRLCSFNETVRSTKDNVIVQIPVWLNLRPTIAESVKEASPGRMVHIWQMRDPEHADGWINLPTLMQQHADKFFAQYQLEMHEAKVRLEKSEIKPAKFEAIKRNCRRPLVLMHVSGQPASTKYIKDHLTQDDQGQLKLKARNTNGSDQTEYV